MNILFPTAWPLRPACSETPGDFRKHRTKTGGNATDGGFFVPAGNQNSNFDVRSLI
ncbi:uncharacterized protein METZ01_LOCUS507952 [marine metagenome]|uniref:Uncharacterized protein n=1 Tax=marine metagenome TaxID=408172 RepID=A0A383EG67_9ZZZZ